MPNNQMAEGYQVPEYFVTDVGKIEDAGGGCVRIFNCIKRDGELIPVFSVVIPAIGALIAGAEVCDTARQIMCAIELVH